MAIRLAHLSDLHFGRKFDFGLWSAVKAEIKRFDPDLLVVSGDMVDEPEPLHLLAAKCELRSFAEDVAAELVVVPGNHDVFASGLASGLSQRQDWFDRIFFNDTAEAERVAEEEFGLRLRLDPSVLNPKRAAGLFKKVIGVEDDFRSSIPARGEQDLVRRPANCDVLLAQLDSTRVPTAALDPIGLATGEVDKADLAALREELSKISQPYLVRIAVIHHHVLPIAFSGGRWLGAEPFMVLSNAGTVLSLFKEHHFDLVLHGHKHVPQYSRIDLMPQHEAGYPIAVLAAGSAALQTGSATGNCLNYVTISENGHIEVEACYYGAGSGPTRSGGPDRYVRYSESLVSAKRRALRRAEERHPIRCRCRELACEITESGDLQFDLTIKGFRGDVRRSILREHRVGLADDSWFVDDRLEVVRDNCSHDVKLELQVERDAGAGADNPRKGQKRRFTIAASEEALRGDGLSYRVRWACANGTNLTRWEAEERTTAEDRADGWDEEWLSDTITHPLDRLLLTLKFPPSLAACRPVLECRRPSSYPAYELSQTGSGDADLRDKEWLKDDKITECDKDQFQYDPVNGLWRLDVADPMVGYNYRIVWKTVGELADIEIKTEVAQQREMLLGAARDPRSWPQPSLKAFDELANALGTVFASGVAREKRIVEFMVYDSAGVSLRPVLTRRSWTEKPVKYDYQVPLGRGLAGAAFQQRRDMPWAKSHTHSPFIKPYPYEGEDDEDRVELKSILAMPIFHIKQASLKRPPPWSCLGVVLFGSSLEARAILGIIQKKKKSMEALRGARGLAHAVVDSLVKDLEGHPS